MSLVAEVLDVATTLLNPFVNWLKWLFHRARVYIFRRSNRKSPLKDSTTQGIAYSVLSGNIVRAISYRNINSKHIIIAAIRKGNENAHDLGIYLLEQFGNTFRPIWSHELILEPLHFEVRDINGDGINEVIFTEESFGTGGGSKVLFVYATAKRQLFQIRESYNWQNAAGPVSPQLDIEPETDKEFLEPIERYAVKLGFLQSKPVDLDSPDYAVQKWHALNGRKRSGEISLCFYTGTPSHGCSISATLDTSEILWIAYFKGPLFGYVKSKNQHFIAYSPSWIYNWVTCLAHDGEFLWFGSHCEPGFTSFKLNKESGYLNYYTYFEGKELSVVDKIECDGGMVILNSEVRIPLNKLRESKTH